MNAALAVQAQLICHHFTVKFFLANTWKQKGLLFQCLGFFFSLVKLHQD